MSPHPRSKSGQFASKSDEPRHVRSIRLTDSAWEKLGQLADKKSTSERCITRADLIEEWLQKSHVIQGQLDLFDIQQHKSQIDKNFLDKLRDVFFDAFGKGRQSASGKAANKALNEMLRVLRDELG